VVRALFSVLLASFTLSSADCNDYTTNSNNTAVLSYSARRYDSAVCCSKMPRDAFLSEALYEADKALEKFASAPWECACLQDGGQSRR